MDVKGTREPAGPRQCCSPYHVSQQNTFTPDGINAADHATGLSSSLDNLAASVER